MADIANFVHHKYAGAYTTTATTATTLATISSTNFVGSGKYLVIFSGMLSVSSAASTAEFKLKWATAGDIDETSYYLEPYRATTGGSNWAFGGIITSPATPEDLLVRMHQASGTQTKTLRQWSAVFIRLDDDLTENTDWFVDVDDDLASPVSMSASYADFATSTHTFASGNWLILPTVQLGFGATSSDFKARLRYSGGGLTTGNEESYGDEGEDATDIFTHLLTPRVLSLDGTSATFAIECRGEVTSTWDHNWSSIVAINLDKFVEAPQGAYTAGAYTHGTPANFEEVATDTFTPGQAGDWLVLGSVLFDNNVAGNSGECDLRLEVGAVEIPATAGTRMKLASNTSTARLPDTRVSVEALTTSSTTISIDTLIESSSNKTLERTIIAFPLELAGGGATRPQGPFGHPFRGSFGGPI